MVIGILKVEVVRTINNNPFYGEYQVKTELSKTIINEKYVGLVPPKNGLRLTISQKRDGEPKLNFLFGKYFYTGEPEDEVDEDTEFSTSFEFEGSVFEIVVDRAGQLVVLNEWLEKGDFEDAREPDNAYKKRDNDVKWELVDM